MLTLDTCLLQRTTEVCISDIESRETVFVILCCSLHTLLFKYPAIESLDPALNDSGGPDMPGPTGSGPVLPGYPTSPGEHPLVL
jgi:hypothetical protein